MKYTVYTLAPYQDKDGNPITLTKHEFDSENEEDFGNIVDYLEDYGDYNQDDFEEACDQFVYENDILEWNQVMRVCMLLSEEQYNYLKTIK